MTTRAPLSVERRAGLDISLRGQSARWPWLWRWESAVAVVAVVAAVAAFWLTINAKFLRYPYWLAVQKADFILGPIFVGLYWRHRRPNNRLGLLLIILGLVGVVYVLESTASPWPFTLGTLSEYLIEPVTVACILAFPSGRLDGPVDRLILGFAFLGIPLYGLLRHRRELAAWENALYGATRQSRQTRSLYTEFDWTRRFWERDEPNAPATG